MTWNFNRDLFRNCIIISLVMHSCLFLFTNNWHFSDSAPAPIEIDLTHSFFLGTGPAKLGAPKPLAPHPKAVEAQPAPAAPPKPEEKPQPQKDWTLPGPSTKILDKPKPEEPPPVVQTPGGAKDGTGTSPLTGGSGQGANYGTPNGTGNGGVDLLSLPSLLNLDEVLANLQRFYPESERKAGHEGKVMLNLHIGTDGSVTRSDVVTSAGDAFDEASHKVAHIMRFKPAMSRSGPVAVVIRQPMEFKLKD